LEGHLGVAIAAAGVVADPEEINAYVRVYASGLSTRLPTGAADVPGVLPSRRGQRGGRPIIPARMTARCFASTARGETLVTA
jgi:hypothetical protein